VHAARERFTHEGLAQLADVYGRFPGAEYGRTLSQFEFVQATWLVHVSLIFIALAACRTPAPLNDHGES
jgi:hypothetical protein